MNVLASSVKKATEAATVMIAYMSFVLRLKGGRKRLLNDQF